MKKSLVTIKDIAEIADVSFSTVSRCLNDSPLVSESTRQKVSDIAEGLGFEFNASARGLITKNAGTVGIILPEEYTKININVYHGMLMNSLITSLEKADVDLIVTYQKNHFTGKNNVNRLISMNKVDALIFLVEDMDPAILDFLESRQVPFVCIHYPPANNIMNQDVIYTDHYAGGKIVAEHLLEIGRRSFILLGVEDDHLEFKLREDGFTETIEKAGGNLRRLTCNLDFESAREVIKKNSSLLKDVDGLFALRDLMALGAMKTIQEEGLNISKEISVVGYDDSEYCEFSNPRLTSVHQPREDMAVITCERLFFQIEKKRSEMEIKKKLIRIQPVLKVRDSS